jgi:hypothetical protein
MPTPSGSEVSINGQPLALARDQDGHYVHRFVPRPVTRNDIPGSPGDETLQPYYREWRTTDFSGGEVGELNSFFDPQDPTAYDVGLANPRVPGQFSGPPTRTAGTPTATADIPTYGPFLGVSNSNLWIAHARLIQSSPNSTAWTTRDTTAAGFHFTCPLASDGRLIYTFIHDTPGGVGSFRVKRLDVDNVTNELVISVGPNARDSLGIGLLAGKFYRWTGLMLKEFDITPYPVGSGSLPLTADGTVVFKVGTDSAATDFPTVRYGGMTATDNSLAFFFSTPGQTFLYEFKNNVGAALSNFLNGFTCKSICYYLGNLWLTGQMSGQACLFRFDLLTRQPSFVNWIRRGSGTALDPVSIAPGPGDQVLIGCSAGEVMVYSKDLDAISELDVRTGDGTLNSVVGFTTLRVAAMGKGSVTLKTSAWGPDDATTTVSGNLTSSEWDFDLPEEATKVLVGFHVSFGPITGAETIVVNYGADGAAATTSTAGTITSATSGAATGNVFLAVSTGSSTVTFRNLRWNVAVTGGAVVKAVTVRMYPIAKDELWDLLIDVSDHAGGKGQDQKKGWELQGILFGTAAGPNKAAGILRANNIVTFLDGTIYPEGVGGTGVDYDTYTAIVEKATLDAKSEIAAVTLRNCSPAV